jgi:hypothetical protein
MRYRGFLYADTPIWVPCGGGGAGAPKTASLYNFYFFIFVKIAALHPGYCGSINKNDYHLEYYKSITYRGRATVSIVSTVYLSLFLFFIFIFKKVNKK